MLKYQMIVESKNLPYDRLSDMSKEISIQMSDIYKKIGKKDFASSDFRGPYPWRKVHDAFYELESRRIGKVKARHNDVVFHAYAPVLQNIPNDIYKKADKTAKSQLDFDLTLSDAIDNYEDI